MSKTFTVNPDSLTSLTNKTVLITGGSSGIGLATAYLIASRSPTNRLIILDRQAPPSDLYSRSPNLLFQQCDITSWVSQRAAFEEGHARFGRIDAVFVNAGIAEYKDQFFTDEVDGEGKLREPDRRTLDIDMNAASDTTKLAIYYLRRNADGGSIVMTASLAGYLASAGAPLYSAAKHGIVGLMRALKNETAKLNIACSVIAPGITVTPILEQARTLSESPTEWAAKMRKFGVPVNKPDTIALAVGYLINDGLKASGKGLLIQADRMVDLEGGLAATRKGWMSEEMLDLFRGGRDAPLFNRIESKM